MEGHEDVGVVPEDAQRGIVVELSLAEGSLTPLRDGAGEEVRGGALF